MIDTILQSLPYVGAIGSGVAGVAYFYWKLKDRRLTDIEQRQRWYNENYEGDHIPGDLLTATIGSIRCRPPKSSIGKLKRYSLKDVGRTEVTLLFEHTEIKEGVWEPIEELLEEKGVRVVSHDYKQSTRSSFVIIEVSGFDSEVVEEAAKQTQIYVDTYLKERQKGSI